MMNLRLFVVAAATLLSLSSVTRAQEQGSQLETEQQIVEHEQAILDLEEEDVLDTLIEEAANEEDEYNVEEPETEENDLVARQEMRKLQMGMNKQGGGAMGMTGGNYKQAAVNQYVAAAATSDYYLGARGVAGAAGGAAYYKQKRAPTYGGMGGGMGGGAMGSGMAATSGGKRNGGGGGAYYPKYPGNGGMMKNGGGGKGVVGPPPIRPPPKGQCTTRDDCVTGKNCYAGNCLIDGWLRFTLAWEGDDDLEFSVIGPDGWPIDRTTNPSDNPNGGVFENDASAVRNGGTVVENIYWPFDGPQPAPGLYLLTVTQFTCGHTDDSYVIASVEKSVLVSEFYGVFRTINGCQTSQQFVFDHIGLPGSS